MLGILPPELVQSIPCIAVVVIYKSYTYLLGLSRERE